MTQHGDCIDLPTHHFRVSADWVDGNGHMNAAYYLMAVKDAAILAHEDWDYGTEFRRRTGQSNFVVNSNIVYIRELFEGNPVRVTTMVVDLDGKRMELLFQIWNSEKNYLAALVRYLVIHVQLGSPPRACEMPEELKRRLSLIYNSHRQLPRPPEVARFAEVGRSSIVSVAGGARE